MRRRRPPSNWLMGEVTRKSHEAGVAVDHSPVSAPSLAELIGLIEPRHHQRDDCEGRVREDVDAPAARRRRLSNAEGLAQMSDEGAIAPIVDAVLAAQADTVAQYRAGQTKVFGFLVGQVMKATGGKASPTLVNELVRRALERMTERRRGSPARSRPAVLDSRPVLSALRTDPA